MKRFEVRINGELQKVVTFEELLEANQDNDEYKILPRLEACELGETITAGGGAAPLFEYKRVE